MKLKSKLLFISIFYCSIIFGQKSNTVKTTNVDEINITTTQTLDPNDPKYYGKQDVTFAFSDKLVVMKTKAGKQIYRVTNQRGNEWGTHFYDTVDKNGNYYEWGFRKIGDETYVYCKATGVDITFGNKFN